MVTNSGKTLERLVAALHVAGTNGANVRWNEIIQGRQFDVTIRFKHGLHEYLTVVECKDYVRKVSVDKIDAFATKTRDVCVNKAIMVSSSGFQSSCFDVARRHNIKLLQFREVINVDTNGSGITRSALNVTSFVLLSESGKECYKFADEGGRFQYLCNHVRFETTTGCITPTDIINDVSKRKDVPLGDGELEFRVKFPGGAVAIIPYEPKLGISGVQYSCKIIDAIVTDKPHLDNYMRESLATSYELVDEDGVVYHSAKAVGLPLGYFNKIEPGKFYSIPALYANYYCVQNDGENIEWILVESYQHGQLLQATLQQKVEYSWSYVEIVDKALICRLNLILNKYLKSK